MADTAAEREQTRPHRRGAFLPLLLVIATLLIIVLQQAWQSVAQRDAMMTVYQAQREKVETSGKIEEQLMVLTVQTRYLAEGGNPHARKVLERFRNAGVDLGALIEDR